MPIAQGIVLAPFGSAHIPQAVALSQAEGWPHRPEDWAMLAGLGRGMVAMQGGRIVGTALTTDYGSVGMCGMIITDHALRGQGLGRRLVEAAMVLSAPQEWRLMATEAGMPLYRKLGFAPHGLIVRHQGQWSGAAPADEADRAGPDDLDGLAVLDRAATGADRRNLLAALLDAGRIVVLRGAGGIVGYAALRRFGRGEVAGPVIASDTGAAQALLSTLLADRAGHLIRLDLDGEGALGPWLVARGLAQADTGAEMRRGAAPPVTQGARRFALASQALG